MKECSMVSKPSYDTIIIGSGPNGLAAGIALAREGHTVLIFEAKEQIGGGCRSDELTLPGFTHDVCSAIHPLCLASAFFRTLPLEEYGVEWIHPEIPLAHPLDNGTAATLQRSIEATGASLGADALTYKKLMQPLVENWETIFEAIHGPLRLQSMQHPLKLTQFGLSALRSANGIARSR